MHTMRVHACCRFCYLCCYLGITIKPSFSCFFREINGLKKVLRYQFYHRTVQGTKRLDIQIKNMYIFDTKTYINMGQKYYG